LTGRWIRDLAPIERFGCGKEEVKRGLRAEIGTSCSVEEVEQEGG
jgi:hypothetical protein